MKTEDLLRAVQEGSCTVEDAMEQLKTLPYENMGYARLDHHRALRTGFPEVIFSQGKTVAHMAEIFQHLYQRSGTVLATRTSGEQYQAVRALVPQAEYNEMARTVTVGMKPESERPGLIAVCTGGTADIPVAEEAAVTAEMCGSMISAYRACTGFCRPCRRFAMPMPLWPWPGWRGRWPPYWRGRWINR